MNALAKIRKQIEAARMDLDAYRPTAIRWKQRAKKTADTLLPWLITVGPDLKRHVQDVLNAPALLKTMWADIRKATKLPREKLEAFDRQLDLDDVLRTSVTGEGISKVVTKYLLDNYPNSGLKSNSRSTYPDIYLSNSDYSDVPKYTKKAKGAEIDEYWTTRKGKQLRPSRVPDGLEIKTCRTRIAVDCHHPHAGLHLVLLFTETARRFDVTDLQVAFLKASDYHQAERNTTATTVKYSFNGDRFVSLLKSTVVKS